MTTSTSPPSRKDMYQLLQVTREFWTRFLELQFGPSDVKFRDVALKIDETRFKAAVPTAEFNVWVKYDVQVEYTLGSALPPNGPETFELMQTADFDAYIKNYVQTIEAFQTTNDVVMELILDDVPTISPSSSLAPSTSPTEIPQGAAVDMIRIDLGGLQVALTEDEQDTFEEVLQEFVGDDYLVRQLIKRSVDSSLLSLVY